MTLGAWPVWAPGIDWLDLCGGPLNFATYICKLWARGFREEDCFKFFPLLVLGSSRPPGAWQVSTPGA